MNTCGTCKFFGKSLEREFYDGDGDPAVVPRLHACELIKHLNAGNGDEERALFESEVAGVVDGSGYHAVLCVSEEFGCVKWEPRPVE